MPNIIGSKVLSYPSFDPPRGRAFRRPSVLIFVFFAKVWPCLYCICRLEKSECFLFLVLFWGLSDFCSLVGSVWTKISFDVAGQQLTYLQWVEKRLWNHNLSPCCYLKQHAAQTSNFLGVFSSFLGFLRSAPNRRLRRSNFGGYFVPMVAHCCVHISFFHKLACCYLEFYCDVLLIVLTILECFWSSIGTFA